MSGGAVYQQCLRRVSALELDDVAARDVLRALEAAHDDALLTLLYESAAEASLSREHLFARACGVFFSCAAGNLADDLVDDDCDWFDPPFDTRPTRVGPAVQYLLQHLSTATLAESLSSSSLRAVALELVRATGPHQVEVRTERFDAETYLHIGEAISGRQWAAHFRALWCETALEDDAARVGRALGFAAHVAHDARDGDRRFFSLPHAARADLIARARRALDDAVQTGRRAALLVEPTLRHGLRNAVVAAYYDEKTRRILDRYGPGPRVHYHTGVVDDDAALPRGRDALRRAIFAAQDALVHESLAAWGLTDRLVDRAILDAGCGLGGTSILLGERGARVTALTICAPHAELVRGFAMEANVAHRVTARVGDVADLDDVEAFDDVIAVEASCYFDRARFFARAARALRPGGAVRVVDLFAGRDDVKRDFDATWRTDLGTLAAYDEAARAAGFTRTATDDLSARCAPFWQLTRADTRALLDDQTLDDAARARLTESLAAHEALERHARAGGLLHLRVAWEKKDP